jgi:Eukaryotic translation initiation factor 3 subunit 7 (eIF-3)
VLALLTHGFLIPDHRYVSRANPRDNTRHVILSTASMRPMDFAGQLNVSLANGWGIVRTVADLCLKMPEGKYVLVKDPNKVSAYSCFAACMRCWRISKARATLGACPDGAPSMDSMDPWLSTQSPAHGLFSCSRLSDCTPSLSRHSPGKRKTKKARRPRKK